MTRVTARCCIQLVTLLYSFIVPYAPGRLVSVVGKGEQPRESSPTHGPGTVIAGSVQPVPNMHAAHVHSITTGLMSFSGSCGQATPQHEPSLLLVGRPLMCVHGALTAAAAAAAQQARGH